MKVHYPAAVDSIAADSSPWRSAPKACHAKVAMNDIPRSIQILWLRGLSVLVGVAARGIAEPCIA